MSRMFNFRNRVLNDAFHSPVFTRTRLLVPQMSRLRPTNSYMNSVFPRDPFFDDFFEEPMILRENFYNLENDVKFNEEPDKYVISFNDENMKNKEVKVDFHKNENALRIQIAQKLDSTEGENKSHFSSNYESTIGFDKPVKHDEILAQANGDNFSIIIPKVNSDADNIVQVKVTGDNIKHLVDSKPETVENDAEKNESKF